MFQVVYLCELTWQQISSQGRKRSTKSAVFNKLFKIINEATWIAMMSKGIWVWNKALTTYEQTKVGLTSIYIKLKVCCDGVSSTPLDL